ncbi:MAG: hypothetical protein RLZZ124_604 [Cyanobacteriota bacterium]|jgi:hypothetical protein
MSFDARSLERLRQLGRTLPQPLPRPEPPPKAEAAGPRRHRVETETDPDRLFHELIQVSEDGTVPPHLLDRLRQAEQERERSDRQRQRERMLRSGPAAPEAARPGRSGGDLRPNPGRRAPASSEEIELYSAFQQLLLEGDEDD